MKILAFSDLHRDVEAACRIVEASVEADVIVGAGDFATGGEGASDTLGVLRAVKFPSFWSLETMIARMSFARSAAIATPDTCCMVIRSSSAASHSSESAAKFHEETRCHGAKP